MECAVAFQEPELVPPGQSSVREASVVSKCHTELYNVERILAPRIPTNREAQWGSALAVFGATDQYKIKVPFGSQRDMFGVKAKISKNGSPLSTQVEKQRVLPIGPAAG
ncbi:hypothetical protein TcYC6_0002340 [Trypanosoma cruzi]|nr:hypothetical protein TcYC6_0002340 [Trypanosoma cruzi]